MYGNSEEGREENSPSRDQTLDEGVHQVEKPNLGIEKGAKRGPGKKGGRDDARKERIQFRTLSGRPRRRKNTLSSSRQVTTHEHPQDDIGVKAMGVSITHGGRSARLTISKR